MRLLWVCSWGKRESIKYHLLIIILSHSIGLRIERLSLARYTLKHWSGLDGDQSTNFFRMSGALEFNKLPDDILLHILKELNLEDLCAISKTNNRLSQLSVDRDLVRCISFEDQCQLKEEDIKFFLRKSSEHVRLLNFNDSYWLSSSTLQWAIQRCRHLQELHVVECRLSSPALVAQLARLSGCLTALSFSIKSFADIKKEEFSAAEAALKELKRLRIFYSSRELSVMSYLGEHTTMLDYCGNLEELVVSSAGMAIPELYRPVVTKPSGHLKLKVMAITNNIHVGAQMLFYGTLSQLPNAHLHWRTLLMPNVNFTELTKNDDFKHCFENIKMLEHLDVSGSKVHFPNPTMDLSCAGNLKHISLRMTLVKSEQLMYIATNCSQLTSVNLYGCGGILYGEHGMDLSGLEALFTHCRGLDSFNMAGDHHHIHTLLSGTQNDEECQQAHRMLNKITGLKRLAIPVCLLREADSVVRPNKRSCAVSPSRERPPTKRPRVMACSSSWRQAPTHKTKDFIVSCKSSTSAEHQQSSPLPLTSQGHDNLNSSPEATDISSFTTVLGKLAENNPDLIELEIIAVDFQSSFRKNKYLTPRQQQFNPCVETRFVRDGSIEPVCHFKQLQSLTLIGIPSLVSANCLLRIAQSCPSLEMLSMGYLGGAVYGNSLSRAVSHMARLQQLRIEQPHLYLNLQLFDGLSHCTRLQQLCIIAKHSSFQPQDILPMVAKLQRLYVIQLFSGATLTACRTLASIIMKRCDFIRGFSSSCCLLLTWQTETSAQCSHPSYGSRQSQYGHQRHSCQVH